MDGWDKNPFLGWDRFFRAFGVVVDGLDAWV